MLLPVGNIGPRSPIRPRLPAHDMFEPLRRWTGGTPPEGDLPIEATIAAMDAGGIDSWPGQCVVVRYVAALDPDDEARELFLSGNARRVFPLPPIS